MGGSGQIKKVTKLSILTTTSTCYESILIHVHECMNECDRTT